MSEIVIDETAQAAPINGNVKARSKGGFKPFKLAKDKRGTLKAPGDGLAKPAPAAKAGGSKTELVLEKLRTKTGATIEALMEATGWQAHSVRGFLSATVKKKLCLPLASETGKDGKRRYRLAEPVARAE